MKSRFRSEQIKSLQIKSFLTIWTLSLVAAFSLFGAGDIYGQMRRKSFKKPVAAKAAEKPLPELKLPDLSGEQWSLHENRGRVVLINFWATWCAPCRTETPMLVKLADEYKTRGLEIVGIALDEGGTDVIKKFVADYRIDYPVLLPVPGSQLSRIDPLPTTLLIDAQGRLAKKYVGALSEKILRGDIEKLTKGLTVKNETTKKRNLTILHTNDIHGHLRSWQGWDGDLKNKTVGGLDRVAAQIEKIRTEAKAGNVLLLDAGDTIGD
ncbi:MAG TPA: redoxin domain-containing protein, partial [Pyrinomonadaceae bacterium]|nr:redoxin domain-containing protein [Pyrinomonadaceae bacterium]